MNQKPSEPESSVIEQQISDVINIDRAQSISSQFKIMKSKMNLKRKNLELSNQQRIIDKLLKQVDVQSGESWSPHQQ